MADTLIINKLVVLYVLWKADAPLSNAQISECLLEREYMPYFSLQESINELAGTGLIRMQSRGTVTFYTLSETGRDTISTLYDRVPESFQKEITQYLQENREKLRDESSVYAEYEKTADGEFSVHCRVNENGTDLFHLTVTVPDEEQARSVCLRWSAKSQPVYQIIMQELLS